MKIAEKIIALGVRRVDIAGGEPLAVRWLFDTAGYLQKNGVKVALTTSGWTAQPRTVQQVASTFSEIHVSLDGGTAATHDTIRGRKGSFDRALNFLKMLDGQKEMRSAADCIEFEFNIDYTVMQSNWHEIEGVCREVAPKLKNLTSVFFGAVVPAGLASRGSYAETELLTETQLAELVNADTIKYLRSVSPSSLQVYASDNSALLMRPDLIASGNFLSALHIESDGQVRAMSCYEGTVGNILRENPRTLWERCVARWSDPFIVDALTDVRSMNDWASATRTIDYHYATQAIKTRIDSRPHYVRQGNK